MKPLTVHEALAAVLRNVPPPRIDAVPLLKAPGHVLAEDVSADRDMPPWDKSQMDGFAVRFADLAHLPADLDVIEEITAGRTAARELGPRQAARIMTGSPVPAGADAVVNLERTDRLDGGRVRILEGVARGAHIARRGEDGKAGEQVLAAGTRIRPAEMGVLASVGMDEVKVYRHPTCAILVTGNELVEVDREPTGGQIRNSNAYALIAQALAARMPYAYLGIVGDDREALRKRLRIAFQADVVLTSGGVSVGDLDLMKECLAAEGVEIVFDQVKIKPGKPITFGMKKKTRVFALPGNPASGFVGFEVFVRPFVAALTRDPGFLRRTVRARLGAPIPKGGDRTQYVPCLAIAGSEGYDATPVPWRGSGDVVGLARSNGLAIVPENCPGLNAGAVVDVLLIE